MIEVFNRIFSVMYIYIFIGLLVLTSLSCRYQQAQTSEVSAENKATLISISISNSKLSEVDKNINELIETFTDDSNIGVPHKNKIELSMFERTQNFSVELKFYSLGRDKKWDLRQTIELPKYGSIFDVQIKDFNNDGLKDVTYVSDVAARGANGIRRLFIYDKKSGELIYIKNSEEYPNLRYNKELNCLDAQRFYGGNATDFLQIKGNMLQEFALVETFGTERKIYLIGKDGRKKLLRAEKVPEDFLFERYKTFNPPRTYSADELKQ